MSPVRECIVYRACLTPVIIIALTLSSSIQILFGKLTGLDFVVFHGAGAKLTYLILHFHGDKPIPTLAYRYIVCLSMCVCVFRLISLS